MKPLFLQYANNETLKGMIEDHSERHQSYCDRHGYHYFPIIRLGEPFDWYDKIRLILNAVKTDKYSHVFWIDADCFVVDGEPDMRETLPSWAGYAFCVHPEPWDGQSFHFNAGVQYYSGYDEDGAVQFLEAVIALEGQCTDEYDQTAINYLLLMHNTGHRSWQSKLSVLVDKWNCTLGVNDLSPDNPPVVAAFHGHEFPERRREVMREWAERLPYR